MDDSDNAIDSQPEESNDLTQVAGGTATKSRTLRRLGFIGIAVLLVFIAAVGIGLSTRSSRTIRVRPPVDQHGWSGTVAHCDTDSRFGDPRDDRKGLVPIGSGLEASAALDGCTPAIPTDDSAYFVVTTASDRSDVRLVEVTPGLVADLVVDHLDSGSSCSVTADWKGKMILVVRGPKGAPNPRLSLRRIAMDC